MSTPQEVLELAIPHPGDSTAESRRHAAVHCIEALQANEYYFVRRQTPVLDHEDGQCPTCKCQLVHVMHNSPAFENAEAVIQHQRLRIQKLENALRNVADSIQDEAARKTVLQTIY